jgi:transcription elongation factor GreA
MPTFISQKGLEDLKQELEMRTKVLRIEIAQQIGEAIELGDLKENFEYHDAKERQGLNEARVGQIEAMLKDAVIVESTTGADQIAIGVQFVVRVDETKKTFSIVGSSEADPLTGKISNESPIGQAFLGKRVGEVVTVTVPSGVMDYTIVSME